MRRSTSAGALLVLIAACSDPAPRPVPARLAITAQPSASAAGAPFTVTVAVQDANGVTVPDAAVPVTVAFGSGGSFSGTRTLGGTATRTSAAGIATFTDLTIDRAGTHVLSATSSTLTPANTAAIAIGAATAASQALHQGDNQVAAPSSQVPVRPAVRVLDGFGNAVAGATVTFAVASGGGSVTGADQVTGVDGVATVGGWTLGASGTNTLTATVTGSPIGSVTFTARVSTVFITGISPALLMPGVVATITGSGFSATPSENVVHVAATPATVSASSPTSITFTVPNGLTCEATHSGLVNVSVLGDNASRAHPIQSARQRTLAIGEALILTDLAETRCNELAAPGSQYLVSVFNTSRVYLPSQVAAAFEVRGAPATAGAAALRAPAAPAVRRAPELRPVDQAEALHARILEENIRILERRRGEVRGPGGTRLRAAPTRAAAVGDMRTVRLPNVNASFCNEHFELNTRVAYAGTRAVILEDVNNTLYSQIDSTYASIGQEFDDTMFGILEGSFGNPLAMDASLDADGKLYMVFSQKFNENFGGLAGFVVSCDFFPRGTTSNLSSNFGEYFYARVPTVSGTLSTTGSPPNWRWSMRSTIIHEVKHITSFGERIKAGAPFEASWLEESTARLSEELYERVNYSFAQRENIQYGSATDPRGPYCGVRGCSGRPRGIARIFEDLNLNWYRVPEVYSPIGRSSSGDFSFYNTGWSLLRWAIDHSSTPESDFIKGLVRGPERDVANLEARAGRAYLDMLGEWLLAMALDDYPGFTPLNARLHQPSWNMRNLMQGLSTDFPNNYGQWPFAPANRTFGSFSVVGATLPGTAAFLTIGGSQTAKQLVELKASSTNDAAPAELRIAIVRIQ